MFSYFGSRARARRTLAVLSLLCAPQGPALAGDPAHAPHAGPHFTLSEALHRAESRHPLFAEQAAQQRAAAARRVQAAQRPLPELGLAVENVLGSGEHKDGSAAETTLSLSQVIERGGLRERRLESADAARELLLREQDIARLELRAEVARRFVHVLADQLQLGLTREATRLAGETYAEVDRRVRAARSPLAERERAQVALDRAQLDEEHAEHELLSSRRHLAAATGAREADFGPAEGELLALPPVAPVEDLIARLDATPDFLRFANATRLAESEMRLAQTRARAPLTVGAGLRRFEQTDDVGLVFSASLPLFGAQRGRGAVLEQEAERERIAPAREQALLSAQAQVFELWQELNHARVEHEAQRDRIVPAMQRARVHTEEAWRRGRYSLLELREAQTEWVAQRRRLIESANEFHQHLIEIQRLTGASAPALVSENPKEPHS